MAKAAKTTAAEPIDAEAAVVPAPLAAAVEEQDTVLQAHFTRQAHHFQDLAPSVEKKAREDAERDARLSEHELIAERNRKEREEQQKAQAEREARENAGANVARLTEEIAALQTTIDGKRAELAAAKKILEG